MRRTGPSAVLLGAVAVGEQGRTCDEIESVHIERVSVGGLVDESGARRRCC